MDWGSGITYFGSTTLKGSKVSFGIKDRDRTEHFFVMGKAESGRMALLARMALQDIGRGVGTVILDATGNLGQLILERLDQSMDGRVVFLDPSDGEFPFSWNPLEDFRALAKEKGIPLLSHALAQVYRFPVSNLSDTLARKLFTNSSSTIIDVYELVTDEKFRKQYFDDDAEKIRFEEMLGREKESADLIAEHGRYIARDTLIRNVVGQQKSKFSLGVLKEDGIVIVDLSRIKMFPTRATPLVRLFMHAAHAHATESKKPASVFLHDCLRYLSEKDIEYLFPDRTLAVTVSDTIYQEEDRKIREQAIARSASIISFLPHHLDLPLAERMFYPYVHSDELLKFEENEFAVALSIDTVRSRPFFAKVLPLMERRGTSHQDLIGMSRGRFTTPRAKVDLLFKKNIQDEDRTKEKKEERGSFSDTFRSIFAKRAADQPVSDAKKSPDSTAQKPAPASLPAPRPASDAEGKKTAATPTSQGVAGSPQEIKEEDLRQMLYVDEGPS